MQSRQTVHRKRRNDQAQRHKRSTTSEQLDLETREVDPEPSMLTDVVQIPRGGVHREGFRLVIKTKIGSMVLTIEGLTLLLLALVLVALVLGTGTAQEFARILFGH